MTVPDLCRSCTYEQYTRRMTCKHVSRAAHWGIHAWAVIRAFQCGLMNVRPLQLSTCYASRCPSCKHENRVQGTLAVPGACFVSLHAGSNSNEAPIQAPTCQRF